MIRHILKIIWNERKANSWILIEYMFVFCILWFCCDYLYHMGKIWREPLGFDIENTYKLNMVYVGDRNETDEEKYEILTTLMDRIRRHPEIESCCLSQTAIPYGYGRNYSGKIVYPDSFELNLRDRIISAEFMKVFRIPLLSGSMPVNIDKEILISQDWRSAFGTYNDKPYPPEKVTSINYRGAREQGTLVTGVVPPLKEAFYETPEVGTLTIMNEGDMGITSDLIVRVKPNTRTGFPERFHKEMREQLSSKMHIFTSVTSMKERKERSIRSNNIYDQLNNVYAITLFLLMNIFLGIIGTFWYRTQARRGEIGLRIAMGATRSNVRKMMCTETLLLLFAASLLAINICIHLRQSDMLSTLGLPMADRVHTLNGGIERDLIIYFITFIILALISLIAVWYPAWRSSTIEPAEALREE